MYVCCTHSKLPDQSAIIGYEDDDDYDEDEDIFQMEDEGDGQYNELDQTINLPSTLGNEEVNIGHDDYLDDMGDYEDDEESLARLREEHEEARKLEDTYEVTLQKGAEGLCMNLGERQGKVRVIEFRPLPNGGEG